MTKEYLELLERLRRLEKEKEEPEARLQELKAALAQAMTEIERYRAESVKDLATLDELKKTSDAIAEASRQRDEEIQRLRTVYQHYEALEHALAGIVDNIVTERLKAVPAAGGPPITATLQEPTFQLNLDRPTLTADEHTLRGSVALLLREGFFDSGKSQSLLKSSLKKRGLEQPDKLLEAELLQFCQWRLLEREFKDRYWYYSVKGARERVTIQK